ncbi:MAG: hypothetical protein IPM25_00050 [Chloracidobacterium sp.]|nr:hypothetical protein [Chloracidobacterium sp.]
MNASPQVYIFIDFDGVLRRSGSPLYRLERELVLNFSRLLNEFPNVQAVISSSWRDIQTLEQLKAYFPEEIRDRIVGATPRSKQVSENQRYREILAFLKFHRKEDAVWFAVDDDSLHFPESAPVIVTNPANGLDDMVLERLRRAILDAIWQ